MFPPLFLRIKHNMAKDKTGTISFYDGYAQFLSRFYRKSVTELSKPLLTFHFAFSSELLIKKGQTGDLEVVSIFFRTNLSKLDKLPLITASTD